MHRRLVISTLLTGSIAVLAAAIWCSQRTDSAATLSGSEPGSHSGTAVTSDDEFARFDSRVIKRALARRVAAGASLDQEQSHRTRAATSSVDDDNRPDPVDLAREAIRNAAIQEFPVGEIPSAIDGMLREQMEDPKWTAEVSASLNTARELNSDSVIAISEIQCYQTMCRIVTNHKSQDDVERFWDSAAEDEGGLLGPGQQYTRSTPEGVLQSSYYLGRYGDDKNVHVPIANRLFELSTSLKYDELQPTPDQVARAAAYIDARR